LPRGNNPGWPAWCFEIFNGDLYFGTDGAVRKAWTGKNDVGAAIEGEVVCAFNTFGDSNRQKSFKLARPIISWDANPAQILIGVEVDYSIGSSLSQITLPTAAGAVWDSS